MKPWGPDVLAELSRAMASIEALAEDVPECELRDRLRVLVVLWNSYLDQVTAEIRELERQFFSRN